MDQYDVMYVDDERNADHRILGRPTARPRVPGRRTVVVPPTRTPTVIYAPGTSPITQSPGYSMNYPYPTTAPMFPPFNQPLGTFAARFGMTVGELLDSAIQVLAAITGLPTPPMAQGDSEIDTANLVIYQNALAKHAKRDEQLRTVGNLLVRILK